MRMRRKDRAELLLRAPCDRSLERGELDVEATSGIQQPESLVADDLLVAAAASLELPGELGAHPFADRGLHVHVHVLVVFVPRERAVVDLIADGLEGLVKAPAAAFAQQANRYELLDVGPRGGDVVGRERTVDLGRAGQLSGDPAQWRSDAAPPERTVLGAHERMNILSICMTMQMEGVCHQRLVRERSAAAQSTPVARPRGPFRVRSGPAGYRIRKRWTRPLTIRSRLERDTG